MLPALRLYLWLATEVLLISINGQRLGSVDCWHRQISTRSLGTALLSIRALRAWWSVGFLLLRGACIGSCYWRQRRSSPVTDRTLGNSVGAIESVACSVSAMRTCEVGDWGRFGDPHLGTFRPLWGLCLRASAPRYRIVTWLILPVVICLSQRLSHACLSISNYTVKLRMAH